MKTTVHSRPRGRAPLAATLVMLAGTVLAHDGAHAPASVGEPSAHGLEAPVSLAELVAPIALLPDDRLDLILPAATVPHQLAGAAVYLSRVTADPGLRPDPRWHEAVLALLDHPELVMWLDANRGWTARLGEAAVADPVPIVAAIARAREEAWETGELHNDAHRIVSRENGVLRITATDPDTVFVPADTPFPAAHEAPTVIHHHTVHHYTGYRVAPVVQPWWNWTLAFTSGSTLHDAHRRHRAHPRPRAHARREHAPRATPHTAPRRSRAIRNEAMPRAADRPRGRAGNGARRNAAVTPSRAVPARRTARRSNAAPVPSRTAPERRTVRRSNVAAVPSRAAPERRIARRSNVAAVSSRAAPERRTARRANATTAPSRAPSARRTARQANEATPPSARPATMARNVASVGTRNARRSSAAGPRGNRPAAAGSPKASKAKQAARKPVRRLPKGQTPYRKPAVTVIRVNHDP